MKIYKVPEFHPCVKQEFFSDIFLDTISRYVHVSNDCAHGKMYI